MLKNFELFFKKTMRYNLWCLTRRLLLSWTIIIQNNNSTHFWHLLLSKNLRFQSVYSGNGEFYAKCPLSQMTCSFSFCKKFTTTLDALRHSLKIAFLQLRASRRNAPSVTLRRKMYHYSCIGVSRCNADRLSAARAERLVARKKVFHGFKIHVSSFNGSRFF